MNKIELMMRRKAVAAFIKADPVFISVTREGLPVQSAAGGYTPGTPETISPQQARIVQNRRRFNNGIVNSEAGDIPHTDYLLLAEFNKDFKVEDTFVWQDELYKITGWHKARTESLLYSIDLLGAPNRDG